jgi:hypothetical protein
LSKVFERLERIEHEIQSLKESSLKSTPIVLSYYPTYSLFEPISTEVIGSSGKSILKSGFTGSSGKIQTLLTKAIQYSPASSPKERCVQPSDKEGEEVTA